MRWALRLINWAHRPKKGENMKNRRIQIGFWIALAAASAFLIEARAMAQTPPNSPAAAESGVDPKTGDVRMPGLVVRVKTETVEVGGNVCLNEGILEFLAVTPKGREYESVLTLNCKPSTLKTALLLIGCEEGDVSPEASGLQLKPGQKPGKHGDRLRITAEWKDGDKLRRAPADSFLWDRKAKKEAKDLPWTFTGSLFGKDFDGHEIFLADAEGAFISLWYNPTALINLDVNAGNPYKAELGGFEINKKALPKVGTPMKIIFERVGK